MTCIAQISEMRSENFIFVLYKLFIFYFFVIETVNSRQVFQFFKIPIFKFHLVIFVFIQMTNRRSPGYINYVFYIILHLIYKSYLLLLKTKDKINLFKSFKKVRTIKIISKNLSEISDTVLPITSPCCTCTFKLLILLTKKLKRYFALAQKKRRKENINLGSR